MMKNKNDLMFFHDESSTEQAGPIIIDDTEKSSGNSNEEKIENLIHNREPYYKRHYLLYGNEEVPAELDIQSTLDFLVSKGFGNNSIKQAREGKKLAEALAKSFIPNKPGAHYCDFCGIELLGMEYDILRDGRERCPLCTRTALKHFEDYKTAYNDVMRNLQAYFGIKIIAPIDVEIINSVKLHGKMGKPFVPTLKPTSRALGFAKRDKQGNLSIVLENGAPRVKAMATMAHEITHIWQYSNWDAKEIRRKYGKRQEIEIYEGMAKWVEIQYLYVIGESAAALREFRNTMVIDNEYSRGLKKYLQVYPLTESTKVMGDTPFSNKVKPL